MLATIRYIKTAGAKDVETSEGVLRMPIYTGTTYRVTNIGMFEDLSFDLESVYIPEEKLADFDDLSEPGLFVVYKITFNRPPFPDQILAGRTNNYFIYVSIDEAEKILAMFTVPQEED